MRKRVGETRSSFFFLFLFSPSLVRETKFDLENASLPTGTLASAMSEPFPPLDTAGQVSCCATSRHALKPRTLPYLVRSHRVERLFREPPSGADEQRRRDRGSARRCDLLPAERAHIGREVCGGPEVGKGRGSFGRRGGRRRRRGAVARPVR